jgi:transcriptional regulator with XRE-family HTH domain
MKINNYIKSVGITRQEFADKVGITVQAISQYSLGKRRPLPDIALRIVAASKGQVSLSDLYAPHE